MKQQHTVLSYLITYASRAREVVGRAAVCEDMFTDGDCRVTFSALFNETSEDDAVLLDVARRTLPQLADFGFTDRFLGLSANPGALEFEVIAFAESAIMRERVEALADAAIRGANLPPAVVLEMESGVLAAARTKIEALHAAFPTVCQGGSAQNAAGEDGDSATDASLLDVPGFVNELTEYSMRAAPRPNRVLSFTGALAMLAHLAGRKFVGPCDAHPNIYLVALAESGVGKDFPQRLNRTIAQFERMEVSVVGLVASGQGLEDAMLRSPTLLCQIDEFDTVLETLRDTKGGKQATEALWQMFLSIFSRSGSVHMTRVKAANAKGAESGVAVYGPSVSLFASAIPSRFYRALCERACTSGFVGRCLVLESGRRGEANLDSGEMANPFPYTLRRMCDELANIGLRFNDNRPVDHRDLVRVPYGEGGADAVRKVGKEADALYRKADAAHDSTEMSMWARSGELVLKLALLYAISGSVGTGKMPEVTAAAVEWAWRLVKSLQLRMLRMIGEYSSVDEMDEKVMKVERIVRQAGKRGISRREVGRKTHILSDVLDRIEDTLVDRGVITVNTLPSSKAGRSSKHYIIVNGK